MQSEPVVFMYLGIQIQLYMDYYVHICTEQQLTKIEAMTLNDSNEGYVEECRGRKERERGT